MGSEMCIRDRHHGDIVVHRGKWSVRLPGGGYAELHAEQSTTAEPQNFCELIAYHPTMPYEHMDMQDATSSPLAALHAAAQHGMMALVKFGAVEDGAVKSLAHATLCYYAEALLLYVLRPPSGSFAYADVRYRTLTAQEWKLRELAGGGGLLRSPWMMYITDVAYFQQGWAQARKSLPSQEPWLPSLSADTVIRGMPLPHNLENDDVYRRVAALMR